MLKTSNTESAKLRKGGVGVGDDSRAGHSQSGIDRSGMDNVKVDGNEVEVDEVGKKIQKLSKSKKRVRSSDFLTSGAKLVFIKLRQAFIKSPILHYFNLERHIRVKTDVSGYVISGVLSRLILDDLGQWHPTAFLSKKMIQAKTRYETYDGELLAIVEAFKTWRHYLEGSQHKVLVPTDRNNQRRFMETKSLSSRQVRWGQKLFCYHFQIDYCQGKINGVTDALFRYPQQNAKKKNAFQAENVKILHHLQSFLSNASLSSLSISAELSLLYQVLIYRIYILPYLWELWSNIQSKIASDGRYANIGGMRLQLPEL